METTATIKVTAKRNEEWLEGHKPLFLALAAAHEIQHIELDMIEKHRYTGALTMKGRIGKHKLKIKQWGGGYLHSLYCQKYEVETESCGCFHTATYMIPKGE